MGVCGCVSGEVRRRRRDPPWIWVVPSWVLEWTKVEDKKGWWVLLSIHPCSLIYPNVHKHPHASATTDAGHSHCHAFPTLMNHIKLGGKINNSFICLNLPFLSWYLVTATRKITWMCSYTFRELAVFKQSKMIEAKKKRGNNMCWVWLIRETANPGHLLFSPLLPYPHTA